MQKKLLYISDFRYEAKARTYYEEDVYLSSQLQNHFDIAICSPHAALQFMHDADILLFRNTGPVMHFQEAYDTFTKMAKAAGTKVFNELIGKADMLGKQYLIDLYKQGYPVIPSIDDKNEFAQLPDAKQYVVKLKHGADSIGMEFITADDIAGLDLTNKFLQPAMPFIYEISFYFINHDFQYALYAPDPKQRWQLEQYEATAAELSQAKQFIEWNDIQYGIQRIDFCKMPNGDLYLMEIEDINPYLSLDLLSDVMRDQFVNNLASALNDYANC